MRRIWRAWRRKLIKASDGAGPLLQRDYWGVIANSKLRPRALIELVAARFADFAPPELVIFRRAGAAAAPLQTGDELEVDIRMVGSCAVRVVHRCGNSLTLATLEGHPEAGRITFGAYPNVAGDVVFHIRSRARASSNGNYVGFMLAGEAMQTNTWVDFINRVAALAGDGVAGAIHAETQTLEQEEVERALFTPTFIAAGD